MLLYEINSTEHIYAVSATSANLNTWRETCPNVTYRNSLSTINLTCTGLGSNQSLRGETPATKAGDTLSSRHVKSCDVLRAVGM